MLVNFDQSASVLKSLKTLTSTVDTSKSCRGISHRANARSTLTWLLEPRVLVQHELLQQLIHSQI